MVGYEVTEYSPATRLLPGESASTFAIVTRDESGAKVLDNEDQTGARVLQSRIITCQYIFFGKKEVGMWTMGGLTYVHTKVQ